MRLDCSLFVLHVLVDYVIIAKLTDFLVEFLTGILLRDAILNKSFCQIVLDKWQPILQNKVLLVLPENMKSVQNECRF